MSVQKASRDDVRRSLAEIGGALTEDDLDTAEAHAKHVLAGIRRLKQTGGRQ